MKEDKTKSIKYQYPTPNRLGDLIIKELKKSQFVGGEKIYDNLNKILNSLYNSKPNVTLPFVADVRQDLDYLCAQGIIARYELKLVENPEIMHKVHEGTKDMFCYTLVKQNTD